MRSTWGRRRAGRRATWARPLRAVVVLAALLVVTAAGRGLLSQAADLLTGPRDEAVSGPRDEGETGPRNEGGAAPGTAVDPVSGAALADRAEVVGTFRAVRVADGDTLEAMGTSGRHDGAQVRIRLAIVDTAEVGTCGADEATALTTAWLATHDDVFTLRRPADAPQTDPFGRVLGEVLGTAGGDGRQPSLNVALLAGGLARIDGRFAAEDPDLLRRLRDVLGNADPGACTDLAPQGLLGEGPDGGAQDGGAQGGGAQDGGAAEVTYSGCDEVRAAGAAPLLQGEPGYDPSMDGDGDGIACE